MIKGKMNYPGLQAGDVGKFLTKRALAQKRRSGYLVIRILFRAEARLKECSFPPPA